VRKTSLLSSWIERRDPLHSFIDLENRPPNQEFGGFLSLDVVVPAHGSLDLEAESLSDLWKKVHEYVSASLGIIGADEAMWFFPRSQAVLGNAFNRQVQLGNHFRSQVQLGNERKKPSNHPAIFPNARRSCSPVFSMSPGL
jgi:hypothetical protein